jgi:hypothetical protein
MDIQSVQPLDHDALESIDHGIRRTVQWLRENRFVTTESSAGGTVIDLETFDGPFIDRSRIVMVVRERWLLQAESERLVTLLREWGIEPSPMGSDTGVTVSAAYFPTQPEDHAAFVFLHGLDDDGLFGRISSGTMN